MQVTFTLGIDGGVEDISSLIRWIDATYNQAIITIDVPEFIPDVAAHAATEVGPVSTILEHEAHERRIRRYERRQHELEYHDQYISIECPLCPALAGQDCVTASGRPAKRVHGARRWAAVYGSDHEISTDGDRLIEAEMRPRKPHVRWARYCMCNHSEDVHLSDRGDHPCTTAMCDCPSFTAVEPFPAVTLDEM